MFFYNFVYVANLALASWRSATPSQKLFDANLCVNVRRALGLSESIMRLHTGPEVDVAGRSRIWSRQK